MRIFQLLPSLLLGFALVTQAPAQDPGAQQDAQAAREKLLKASDTLDNIEANSEATKTSIDAMKPDITKLQADVSKLQSDNAALQQQVDSLQAALQKSEEARAKERQVILDEVAKLVASGKSSSSKSISKKKDISASNDHSSTPPPDKTDDTPADKPAKPPVTTADDSTLAPPPDPTPASTPTPAPVRTQKGYYHIVAEGETLTLICNAYRQDGVNVTVGQVMRANDLNDKSILKVGQKLFIPKPGN